MKRLILIFGFLGLVGCNADQASQNGFLVETEADTVETELSKMSTEHDEELDTDEYEDQEEISAQNGRRVRRRVRRFISRRINSQLREELRREVAPIFDLDGSGELDEAEGEVGRVAVQQCRSEIRSFLRDYYDSDGDGKLSREEYAVLKEKRKQRRELTKDTFDGDSDGELSEVEKQNLVEFVAGQVSDRLLDKYDSNNDNTIDADEANATELIACEPFEDVL